MWINKYNVNRKMYVSYINLKRYYVYKGLFIYIYARKIISFLPSPVFPLFPTRKFQDCPSSSPLSSPRSQGWLPSVYYHQSLPVLWNRSPDTDSKFSKRIREKREAGARSRRDEHQPLPFRRFLAVCDSEEVGR